jgi:ubiquinone/menaquinone biosynthesis C-methylase UbiE
MGSEWNGPEAFKRRDASSYDGVAESFARFSDRFTSPIARSVVELATLAPTSRVLDVGTGTGIVALEAAKRLGPEGRVVGIDLSEGMLETARAKASVVSLYALLHFPRPELALAQMFRVLRPGGCLVLAVGARPPLLSLRGLVHLLRRVSGFVQERRGRSLAGPAFLDQLVERFLAGSSQPRKFERAQPPPIAVSALRKRVRAAGFVEIRAVSEAHLGVLSTPEEFWELQVAFSSFSRKRLESTPPERIELLRAEFITRCRDVQARGGRLTYPYAAYIIRARRPLASAG